MLFHMQNGGDCEIPLLQLKPGLGEAQAIIEGVQAIARCYGLSPSIYRSCTSSPRDGSLPANRVPTASRHTTRREGTLP
jgi:hypothetical protein